MPKDFGDGLGRLEAGALPNHVVAVDQVPHDWQFPKMAAVVHHCGAETTAAGLRAGVPAVAIPHMGDQFYWARWLHDLGVAPRALPRKKLRVDTLVSAIEIVVHDDKMRSRAAALGAEIRAAKGAERAVKTGPATL